MPSFLSSSIFANTEKMNTVLVCYGKLAAENIKGYCYVILESKYYSPKDILKIKSQNEKVYAYISLGEVNENAPHYSLLKDATLGKNNIWNSYYLDLKSAKTKIVLFRIMDELMTKGYDGLFLDNIDNYTSFGTQKEQKAELINLLQAIKEKYPQKEFIQNAGLEIINETANYVNAILLESVATDYSFKNNQYKLRNSKDYEAYINRILRINEKYNIPIILIEYVNSESLKNSVLNRISATGFDYFLGKIDLQTIP